MAERTQKRMTKSFFENTREKNSIATCSCTSNLWYIQLLNTFLWLVYHQINLAGPRFTLTMDLKYIHPQEEEEKNNFLPQSLLLVAIGCFCLLSPSCFLFDCKIDHHDPHEDEDTREEGTHIIVLDDQTKTIYSLLMRLLLLDLPSTEELN